MKKALQIKRKQLMQSPYSENPFGCSKNRNKVRNVGRGKRGKKIKEIDRGQKIYGLVGCLNNLNFILSATESPKRT